MTSTCEFPGEIRGIVDASVEAEAAGRRKKVHGVAEQIDAALLIVICHERESGPPLLHGDDFCADVRAYCPMKQCQCIDVFVRHILRYMREDNELAFASRARMQSMRVS